MQRVIAAIIAFAALWVAPGSARGQIFVTNVGGNPAANTIGKYSTAGATINTAFISGLNNPTSMAISGGNLFVVNNAGGDGNGSVGKYDASTGATINSAFISGLVKPWGIAVFGGNLFVTDLDGKIGKYDATTGTTINSEFVSGSPGLTNPLGIVFSGGSMFVVNGTGFISEYDATTGALINGVLVSGLSNPQAVAVSGGNLFVSNYDSNTIGKYTTSGATVNSALVSGLSGPRGIAVSGGNLFVVNFGGGNSSIGEYSATTGAAVNNALISSGLNGAEGVAVIPEPPIIISPLAATGTVGQAFVYQFEAVGATDLSVDPATLPPGLTFDTTLSAIVGIPTDAVTFQVGLSASNSVGTTNATLILTIQPLPTSGPVITSSASAKGRTGSPFNFQVVTSGGTAAARLSATGLPAGLSIDSVTGEISGTATTYGSFLVTLSATEAGITNTATLELTFTSDLAVPVIVSPNSAPLFPSVPFSYTIMAPTSDSSDQVTYTEIGPLPPGLNLDSITGIISGTPLVSIARQPTPQFAGGVISNVQAFACNSSGCGVQSLFLLKPTGAANISTRLSVGTGDNVLIGGFITLGDPPMTPMKLMVRGIGPSLPATVAGPLADPYLELHSGASTIAMNDNWMDNLAGGSQKVPIENATYPPALLAPASPLESAILAVLDPGPYTAVLQGTNNGTGVGLVEVYKLGAASSDGLASAILANISTRGKVQTGDNVMIGGFINQGSVPIQVVVRGIGPSLSSQGVSGALANPVLELHKPDGSVMTNDNWKATQETGITATGLAPSDDLESAILLTLPVGEGAYTAIVSGAGGTSGVGLVEAYFGNPCLGTSCP